MKATREDSSKWKEISSCFNGYRKIIEPMHPIIKTENFLIKN